MNDEWLEQHKNLINFFDLVVTDDNRNDLNLAYKELSKMVVFVTRRKNAQASNDGIQYHGFDTIKEAFDLLLSDMVGNVYADSGMHDRYSIVSRQTEIIGTMFRGKLVKFHPVTSGVAVLIHDPSSYESTDELTTQSEYGVIAGTIPYINLEVVEHESQESKGITQDNKSDDNEPGRQGELFDSSTGNDSEGAEDSPGIKGGVSTPNLSETKATL